MEQGDLDQASTWLNDALVIKQEIGHKDGVAVCLLDLSTLAFLQDNPARFKQTLGESLTTARGTSQAQKIYTLTSLMTCPFFQKPENSVPLLRVIDFQSRQLEYPLDPLRKRDCDRAEAIAREAMGDAAFEAACAEGARLTIDEALDLVLQKVNAL